MDSITSFFESVWNKFGSLLGMVWYWFTFLLIAIVTMPAMWVLVYLYPTWQTWIVENDKFKKHWERILLIIPFSILIGIALILYRLFHGAFEARVGGKFGKKPFG